MSPSQRNPESPSLLHVHSKFSLLPWRETPVTGEGVLAVSSPKSLVERAKNTGHLSIALTDTNFFGLAEAIEAGKENEIKVAIGWEHPVEFDTLQRWPATLLARGQPGLQTLFSLNNLALINHQPITPDTLAHPLESGEIIGLFRGHLPQIRDLLEKDYAFLALDQPDGRTRKLAQETEQKFPGKTVVSHEVRIASAKDAAVFGWLAEAFPQRASGINPRRILNHTVKTPFELRVLYSSFPKGSIGRVAEIAQEINIDLPKIYPPRAKCLPQGENAETYLQSLVWKSFSESGQKEELRERVRQELEVIKASGFADFVLTCWEVARFFQGQKVEYNLVGSGNNSFVLGLLGISRQDAAGLMFERFLNPERTQDIPDIDFAVAYDDLPEAKNYLKRNYPDTSLEMSVVQTMGEATLKELSKQHQLPLSAQLLQELENARLPLLVCRHPTGTLLGKEIRHRLPQIQVNGHNLAQIDKTSAKDWRLAKIDLVASVAAQRVATAKQLLNKNGIVYQIDPDDSLANQLIASGETVGVSLVESPHLQQILAQFGRLASRFTQEHTTQALALARPAAGARKTFFEFAENQESPLATYPEIARILRSTNFTPIYQEQILQIARDLAGLPWEIADRLRKIMTASVPKEKQDELFNLLDVSLENRGYPEPIRHLLLEKVKQFSSYGFMEGHARALALSVHEQAYLLKHYPSYFWAAVLKTAGDNKGLYPTQIYINQALRDGVTLALPESFTTIPADPIIKDGKVILGRKLLAKEKPSVKQLSLWTNPEDNLNIRHRVKEQLERYGICTEVNPIILFPSPLHFNPGRHQQEIVGYPAAFRLYKDLFFLTLDSGEMVHLTGHFENSRKKIKRGPFGFLRVKIRRSEGNPNRWEII